MCRRPDVGEPYQPRLRGRQASPLSSATTLGLMRWLLLDLGGVLELVDDDAWPDALAARWAGEVGLTPQKFRAELRTLDLPRTDLVAGTEAAYWRSIGDHFALPSVHLQRWRNEFWDAYCGTLNTELFAVVRSLRGTCGLAVLSNSGDGAREQEEARFALSDVFSPICYSHEIGHNKPDPEAFVAALSAMNARRRPCCSSTIARPTSTRPAPKAWVPTATQQRRHHRRDRAVSQSASNGAGRLSQRSGASNTEISDAPRPARCSRVSASSAAVVAGNGSGVERSISRMSLARASAVKCASSNSPDST